MRRGGGPPAGQRDGSRGADGASVPRAGGADDAPDEAVAIRIHLDELLARHELTLTQLSERVGVTIANLSILKNGRARAIRFSTLARLCEALDCQPGDLLVYESAATAAGTK